MTASAVQDVLALAGLFVAAYGASVGVLHVATRVACALRRRSDRRRFPVTR